MSTLQDLQDEARENALYDDCMRKMQCPNCFESLIEIDTNTMTHEQYVEFVDQAGEEYYNTFVKCKLIHLPRFQCSDCELYYEYE